jgi:hypothetical protein
MVDGDGEAYLGLLSFLSFGFSVIAAVLAIDMYTLLRTGEFGKTWRVLIIASVMFALAQVLRMAELLNWRFSSYGLSQIVELMFVLALAYSFFLQRQAFTQAAGLRGEEPRSLRRKTADRREGTTAAPAPDSAEPDAAAVAASGAPRDADALEPLRDDDEEDIEWSHHVPKSAPRSPHPVSAQRK